MATSNGNRDVTLAVGIKTSGEDALRSLAAEVQNLAKRGGDAAPAYQALATELTRLSQQAGQLEAFKALSADIERLTLDQQAASQAASDLAAKLELQRKATSDAADAEARAQAALKETRDNLAGKRYELAQLNIDTAKALKSEDDYLKKSKDLKQEILNLTVELRARREAMRDAASQAEAAEKAEDKLATQYERSAKAAGQIDSALTAQREAMTRTVAAAEQLGLSITDAAAAEEKLLAAQQKIVSGVSEARIAAAREQAEADRLAITEKQALAELYERGRVALLAETAAIKEAADGAKRYAQVQAEVAAEVARLEQEEQRAAQAMREVAAATTKANEEALRLSANADRIRFYAQAFDELAERERKAMQEAQDLAQAGQRAGEALREAFGTTGVRSLQAVQSEVGKVGEALNLLQANYRAGAISAADLERATSSAQVRLAQLRQEALTIPSLPNVFERINSTINDLIGKFGSLGAAIATVGFAVKPVIDADIQLESLRRTLTAVTGSAKTAGEQIDFLRKTANDNGLQVGKLSQEYTTFVSALLKSGISMKDTQALFGGVAAAANTLGLSTERASLILLALSQTASKGKVSLEEVQSQIGESLPGALKIMADSLGLSTAEFTKLSASGKLLADEFLPRFGAQLQKTFGGAQQPVDGLQQAFAKLSNKFTELQQKLVDTAFFRGLVSLVQGLTNNFEALATSVGVLGKAFLAFKAIDIAREFFGVKAAAEAAAAAKELDAAATTRLITVEKEAAVVRTEATAAVTRETVAVEANTAAKTANVAASRAVSTTGNLIAAGLQRTGEVVGGATRAVGGLISALGGLPGVALTATIALQDQLGKGIAYVAAKFSGAIGDIERFEAAQKASAEAEKARAEQRRQQAELDKQSVARLLTDTQKQIDQAENAVKVATELAAAKKLEGEASVELARLTGSETRLREASTQATRDNETAQRAIATALQARIDAELKQRQVLIDNKGGVDNLNAAEKETLRLIDETLKQLEAKKQKIDEEVAKEHALAVAAQLSAEKLKDQSGSLEQNVKELEVKRKTLADLIELEKAGVVSADTVTRARTEEAAALARVNESLRQRLEKAGQEQKLRAADIQITKAKLDQNLAEERSLEAVAAANNDVFTAEASKIRQKEISLQQTKADIAATLDKARVDQQVAQQELATRTDLTEAQRRDLELKIKLAQASEAEAQARNTNVSAVEAEIRALRQRLAVSQLGNGVAPGVASTAGGIGSTSTASSSTSSGLMAGAGGGPVDASYVFDLWARYQQGRVAPDELPAVKNALQVAINNARLGGPGSVSLEGKADDQMWIGRLQQIVDALEGAANTKQPTPRGTRNTSSAPVGGETSATGSGASAATAPSTSAAAAQPVNVYIGGQYAGTVNVAGQADAATLRSVLEQLTQSSGRAA